MAYPPPVTAALTGASIRQLSYWRHARKGTEPLLVPELAASGGRVLYSYRDVVALRMFVYLREATSLQRIRRAVSWLQETHPDTHLSTHRLKAHPRGRTIVWISPAGDFFDVVEHPGQQGIRVVMADVFGQFSIPDGRRVPNLANPAPGVQVDPQIRGGYPVIAGTRVPYDVVAGLKADGLDAADIAGLYPGVGPEGVDGAVEFAELVADVEPIRRVG